MLLNTSEERGSFMGKLKLHLKDRYKILGIAIALATMVFCFMHGIVVKDADPRMPGKEWWAIASYLLTSIFAAKVEIKRSTAIEHTCGVVICVLLTIAGLGEFFEYDVGSQFWSIVGSTFGIYFGLKDSIE